MSLRPQDSPGRAYKATRYHLLNECRRVRAMGRVGTAPPASCRKERRALQGEMARIRGARKGT